MDPVANAERLGFAREGVVERSATQDDDVTG
jgi:hypothetical protein